MSTESKLCGVLLAAAITASAFGQAKRPAKTSPSAAPQKASASSASSKPCPIPRNENQQVYRLYMKDGSYQPVTTCELLDGGQRVHYMSAERHEAEDVPSSLVDWVATDKIAKEGPPTEKAEA